jgi:hypothetical protein
MPGETSHYFDQTNAVESTFGFYMSASDSFNGFFYCRIEAEGLLD